MTAHNRHRMRSALGCNYLPLSMHDGNGRVSVDYIIGTSIASADGDLIFENDYNVFTSIHHVPSRKPSMKTNR